MKESRRLEKLARSFGIQVTFRDVQKQLQTASAETIVRTLREFGVALSLDREHDREIDELLRDRRQERWQQVIEPVQVAWDGRLSVAMRLPRKLLDATATISLIPDDEMVADWRPREFAASLAKLQTRSERSVEGVDYVLKRWRCPEQLPPGYFRLVLEVGAATHEARVISAPSTAWRPPAGQHDRLWGVFVPLYALHTNSSWGAGDFSDLEHLIDWVDGRGGDLVATLPLLASQSDFSGDPSPYSPTSRLFWNEFYLDLTAIPEFEECEAVRDLVQSVDTKSTLQSLRQSRFVDYRREGALKRRILEQLSQFAFDKHNGEPPELKEFCESHPEVISYARYRAVSERLGRLWPDWPEPLHSGTIVEGDYDLPSYRYHLFVQWHVHRQLESIASRVRKRDMVWYLDFPLGVSSHGYDVWRHRELFATHVSGGAPPDSFFTKGQNWGFPPLHPQRIREDGYRYFGRTLQHHLEYAKLLRIDHVMGLHRLFWIPHGLEARQGAYVKYAMDEQLAVISLESHRYQAVIIGENLGTVPDIVNELANRHSVGDMYVVQYEANPNNEPTMRPAPAHTVASLNTHDMPSFTAYWTSLDVDERVDLDLMTQTEAAQEREVRARLRRKILDYLIEHEELTEPTRDPLTVQAALLSHLGRSDAHVVFATLEDLWQEVEPQNTPGTYKERRNWQRKLRYSLEQWTQLPDVARVLSRLHESRKAPPPDAPPSAIAPTSPVDTYHSLRPPGKTREQQPSYSK